MAYIRGQERFVYQRVYESLQGQLLGNLGWDGLDLGVVGAPVYPYGASIPLTFLEQPPDPKLTSLDPNTVALSEGRMPDEQDEELGGTHGGLVSTTHTFFVDVYGEKQSIARSLAGDIRAIFTGRLPNTSRYLTLPNYLVAAPYPDLAGHLLSFEDVEVDFPAVGSVAKLHWAVVKLTCVHQYNG